MEAVKIPVRTRLLLMGPQHPLSLRPFLKRWAGELPPGGVLTATGGLQCGCCGHYSFWKRRILRHQHPGDRPVPADMQAALRGEAPVPHWFLERRDPDTEADR
jgi:hypothetical protein